MPRNDNAWVSPMVREPERLLVCPFCGAEPVVQPWHGGGPNKISIGCENDEGCVVQPSVCDDDPEVARAMWNGRPDAEAEARMVQGLANRMSNEKFNQPGTLMWIRAQVMDWVQELRELANRLEGKP